MPAELIGGAAPSPLRVRWSRQHAIVNLRANPQDSALMHDLSQAVGLGLPHHPSQCPTGQDRRVVWAGPDDWFVLGAAGTQDSLMQTLRQAAGPRHCAVTDVSSGYAVLGLSGAVVREVLAQGCPLDLDPRVFGEGHSAGTHFFKASVWLWRTGAHEFELLVRSSFAAYVETLLERCTVECGRA